MNRQLETRTLIEALLYRVNVTGCAEPSITSRQQATSAEPQPLTPTTSFSDVHEHDLYAVVTLTFEHDGTHHSIIRKNDDEYEALFFIYNDWWSECERLRVTTL